MNWVQKEILKWWPNEDLIKLSEVEKKLKIKVPEYLLKDFWNVFLNRKQTKKMENGKLSTEELSKLKLEQLRWNLSQNSVEKVNQDINKSNKIEDEWTLELSESGNKADKAFEKAMETITGVKSNKKLRQGLVKAKNINSQAVEKVKDISQSLNTWEKLENIPFIWGLFKILAGLLGFILWTWKGIKELFSFWDKAKEKLSSKEIQNTKKEVWEKIKTDLLGKFGKIHPKLKEKLEEKVEDPNFISEENIRQLKEMSDKNGKLELRDIKYVLSKEEYTKIGEELKNDPDVWEAVKLKYETQLVNGISKEYGINLQGDKKAELKKLIQEKWAAEKIDILQFYTRVENGETITLWDLTVWLFDEAVEATWFTMSLLGKWVVTADKFIFNIVEWGTKLMFGLAGLGLKHSIDLEDFKGSLEKMDEKEKILVLWLLYRKWGILFELLWHIGSFISTQVVESFSSSSVTKWELLKASGSSNIERKMKTFQKLENMLGWGKWMEILNGALENQKLINRNNRLIKILEYVDSLKEADEAVKAQKLKKLLQSNWFSIEEIKHLGTTKEIRSTLSKITKTNSFTGWQKFKGYFWKNLGARQIEFYRNIDTITLHQSKVIAWENKALRILSKTKETLHALKIGKNAERVLLEAKTAKWVITKLEALKRLSLEAPDLLKSICRWLPEIAVLWLAAGTREENESIMEAMIKVAPFLTRIIWPWMMIFSLWWAYKDGKLQWVNVTEAGLWTIFMWLDAAAAIKIFWEHWFSGKTSLEIGKFIVKPLTAPLDIAVKWANFWKSFWQMVKAQWSTKEVLKEVGKKTLIKVKNIKAKKAAIIAWAVIGSGYLLKEIFDEDFDDRYEKWVDGWIIDPKTWEVIDRKKAKTMFWSLKENDKEEKIDFIRLIYMTEEGALIDANYLNFEIDKKNNLTISPKENPAIWDWVTTGEIEAWLKEIWVTNIDFNKNTPEK